MDTNPSNAADESDRPTENTHADEGTERKGAEPTEVPVPLHRRIGGLIAPVIVPVLVPVLAGLLVIALVVVAALGYRVSQSHASESGRSAAMAAARTAAADILSYDYRHLDRDFARAKAHLTGKFANDYAQTAKTLVRPTASRIHAIVTAEVRGVSVVSSTPDQAVVLLFVNQTTKSDVRKGARTPDQNRVRMTMERVGDRWLVGKVEGL